MEGARGSKVRVVAALVEGVGPAGEATVLLARRGPGQRHAGLWELPGGKVEPGEEPEDALIRELEEELGVVSRIAGAPRLHCAVIEGRDFEFLVYPALLEGEPLLRVHDALARVRAEELGSYELAPLDEPALADWAYSSKRTRSLAPPEIWHM